MHVSDGVLTESLAGRLVLAGTSLLAAAGVGFGLRRMDQERIPRVAVMACVFFVVSLVPFRLGPTSAHLGLSGLAGVLLGWSAFPAFLVAIALQALFFGHGGVTMIGVNTFNFGLAALLGGALLRGLLRRSEGRPGLLAWSFLAGALPVLLTSMAVALELLAAGRAFTGFAGVVLVGNLPVALVEGMVTAAALSFLRQVRPEALQS